MRTSSAILAFLFLVVPAMANACENWAAMVVSVNGYVVVKNGAEPSSEPVGLQPDSTICPGQQLEVGANSRAAIYLSNNSFVRLDENTVMTFPAAQSEGSFWVELKQGVSHFISRITMRFGVKTAYTNAVVDGTEFLVTANPDNTQVSVVEGTVTVTIGQRGIDIPVQAGQGVIVDSSPEFKRIELSATDSVDWAIYFPPLVVVDELVSQVHQGSIRSAAEYLKRSRPDLAIQELESIVAPDSATKVALAASYMAVGDIAGAEGAIKSLGTPQAQALRSLISVVINQPQQALALAKQIQGNTLSSKLALSYAYQANLDLPSALNVARDAAQQYPGQYMAWVRLSEMQVAMGDVGAAADSIAQAKRLAPGDAAVLVQAAFVDMFNNRFKQAEEQFGKAIALYSENPQARLGLGLVLLRQGDLEAGRKQIEYAVSLDPARSVLRSYLGRAYFEEKRDDEAAVQWELAKQMDPEDPTAYFYTGIQKYFQNKPYDAIEDLQVSQEKNHERNLYRSETVLQSDASSRSATLARSYDEIGYNQGALLAGWESLRQDPTNPEGHRLLSDHYQANSRFDRSKVSELLQSQLWSDVSMNTLSPQMSESGISVVEKSGPQNPGFNEYNSLYKTDGAYGYVNGYGAGDGTWGDDLVGSFLAGPISFGVGQYHFESDGWKENAAQEQNAYSAFLQVQVTASTSIQFESRKFDWEHGDLFDTQTSLNTVDFSTQYKRETNRFGLKHRMEEDIYFLMSVVDQNIVDEVYQNQDFPAFGFYGIETNSNIDADPQYVELQWVRRFIAGYLLVGANYYEEQETRFANAAYLGQVYYEQTEDIFYDEIASYVYYSSKVGGNFGVDVGGEFKKGKEERSLTVVGVGNDPVVEVEIDKLLPKLGVYYETDGYWVLRMAMFDSFQRKSVQRETIEPTSFLGFNQFFTTNFNYVDSRRRVVSADHKMDRGMAYGVSVSDADLHWLNVDVDPENERSGSEVSGEMYVNTVSEIGFAAGVSYKLDKFEYKTDPAIGYALKVKGTEVPVYLKYFYGNSVVASLNGSYYMQEQTIYTGVGLPNDEVKNESFIWGFDVAYKFGCRCGDLKLGVDNVEGVDKELLSRGAESLLFYPGRLVYGSLTFSM